METRDYDYIIVGAGSAGAALANRLTASGRHRVLLLEAGGKTHPLSRVPVSFAKFINRPGVNWLYSSEAEPMTGGRNIPVPRGKMLGGSSAINGMVWVRGQPQDFDTWAQLGNRGWSYQDVLPVFKRMESYDGGDGEYRGRGGPLRITDTMETGRLYDSLFEAADPRRHQAQRRLQRPRPGRHCHDAGLHRQRPAHEHGALLSRSDPQQAEHRYRDRRAGRAAADRRQTLHRRALPGPRRGARGKGDTRGDRLVRRHRLAATARALRHRPARPDQGARASRSSTR